MLRSAALALACFALGRTIGVAVTRGSTSLGAEYKIELGTTGGWDPTGAAYPPAPPYTFPADKLNCSFAGQTRKIAFIHIGKTGGSSLHGDLLTNGVNWTEFELGTRDYLRSALPDDFDMFVISVRDPQARTISAWNFEHPIGGGDNYLQFFMNESAGAPYVPLDLGTAIYPIENDPATEFNTIRGEPLAPYLVPNMTESALDIPATYMEYGAALPTGPKPLQQHMFRDCFPELPGGVSKWAEALDQEGTCGDLARRALHEHAEATHINQAYAYMIRDTGVLERLRLGLYPSMTPSGKGTAHTPAFFILNEETMDADEAAMWDWLCIRNPLLGVAERLGLYPGVSDDYPRHDDTRLSHAANAALKKHLVHEYHVYKVLQSLRSSAKAAGLM